MPPIVEPSPAPSAPVEPAKELTNSIGMTLMLIPAGEFWMGSPGSDKDAFDNEKPRHRVRITHPFYLGATEVTVGQTYGTQTQITKGLESGDKIELASVTVRRAGGSGGSGGSSGLPSFSNSGGTGGFSGPPSFGGGQ